MAPENLLNHIDSGARRASPGATNVQPGNRVTTGTWTDAWPLLPGEHWQARLPLQGLQLALLTTS
jgi:2-oxo-3-hexenedioate decarboxylase